MLVLLDPAGHPVVGHRGNRAHAPENTLESFAQAIALGVDALEFDVHLSRDGVPVVMHDPTVDRTTNGTGAIDGLGLGQLRALDAGFRFSHDRGLTHPYRGRAIGVPTLEDALAATGSLPLIIEMKSVAVAGPALEVIRRTGHTRRVLIGSFMDEALAPFQAAGIPVGAASGALARLYLPALFGSRPHALPFQAMCLPRFHRGLPVPVRQFARVMRGAGGAAHVWTVNDAALARRLWARGVNGIISDDPATILAARGRAA